MVIEYNCNRCGTPVSIPSSFGSPMRGYKSLHRWKLCRQCLDDSLGRTKKKAKPTKKTAATYNSVRAKMLLTIFKREIANMWENPELLKDTEFSCNVSTRMTRALAKVTIAGGCSPYSVGRKLMVAPRFVKLTVSHRVLDMEEERILGIIKHEAVHLGHWNHGPGFKAMALSVGASINGEVNGLKPMEKKNIFLQVQFGRGTRYKNYQPVSSYEEGRRIGKELSNKQLFVDGKYLTGLRIVWNH